MMLTFEDVITKISSTLITYGQIYRSGIFTKSSVRIPRCSAYTIYDSFKDCSIQPSARELNHVLKYCPRPSLLSFLGLSGKLRRHHTKRYSRTRVGASYKKHNRPPYRRSNTFFTLVRSYDFRRRLERRHIKRIGYIKY